MKDLKVVRIEKRFSGYGHNKITISVTGNLIDGYGRENKVEELELKCTSTNTQATDAYFDELYDQEDNEGAFYESRYEAVSSLVDEVLRMNNIESTYEIEDLVTLEDAKGMRSNY